MEKDNDYSVETSPLEIAPPQRRAY